MEKIVIGQVYEKQNGELLRVIYMERREAEEQIWVIRMQAIGSKPVLINGAEFRENIATG